MSGEPAIPRGLLERELAIRQELARRYADDPLKPDRPHPGQRPFINSVLSPNLGKTENWFIAANRTGKTDAGAFCGATLARFGDDRARFVGAAGSPWQVRDRSTAGWVSSLDFSFSRDVVQPKYFDNGHLTPGSPPPFIPQREISHWDRQDQVLKLKNGSIIGFKSADSGRAKYQGADRGWLHLDEEHPHNIYKEATLRVGSTPLLIFCTMTLLPPEGVKSIGPSWCYELIYKPWQAGAFPHMGIFTCSIYQNPFLPPSEISRLESMYPLGSIDRRIRLDGEILPGMGGTRAYGNFDTALHVRQQDSYNHLLPLCWCLDFNVEPMLSVVGQRVISYGQVVFRFLYELMLETGSIPEMVQLFYDTVPRGYRMIHIYGDSTGGSRNAQTGVSDYRIILNHMTHWNTPTKLFIPKINPPVPDRINAVNNALLDEQKISHVEVDPSCTELCADFEQVLRDPRGGLKKTFNRQDPYFKRTHASDAAGYWIAYERPVAVHAGRGGQGPGQARPRIPSPSYQGQR